MDLEALFWFIVLMVWFIAQIVGKKGRKGKKGLSPMGPGQRRQPPRPEPVGLEDGLRNFFEQLGIPQTEQGAQPLEDEEDLELEAQALGEPSYAQEASIEPSTEPLLPDLLPQPASYVPSDLAMTEQRIERQAAEKTFARNRPQLQQVIGSTLRMKNVFSIAGSGSMRLPHVSATTGRAKSFYKTKAQMRRAVLDRVVIGPPVAWPQRDTLRNQWG